MIVTLGTGIGSALFSDGVLVPNTEFGHLEIRGKAAEDAGVGEGPGGRGSPVAQVGQAGE